jgi:tetratricopeptide (TPR) repeat protein
LALEHQDVDEARKDFERLTSLVPDEASAHGKLASAMELGKDVIGADRELKKALELEPENLEFTARLGLLHAERYRSATKPAEKKAEREQAEKYLQDVLRRQPENAIASRTLEALRQ